jgi:hypothetical protein
MVRHSRVRYGEVATQFFASEEIRLDPPGSR